MGFKEVKIEELQFNPFTKIGKEWLLITAGNSDKFNTMTASWGGVGVYWSKNVVTTYIRPQRYTKEFVDNNDTFTIAFFDEKYREALNICGTISGRDTNKVEKAGLTPYFIDDTVAFEEANMIMVCKKLYHDTMPPENFDAKENDEKWYPKKDYHTMYISEVVKVLIKE
ncbi:MULTISPECIES: flavin reductase [unclassified Clostridioides]|uniref:flavin reductase n=1 Tax=unclassified Clostridioides TaxID=2635829 RepID=UPI001D126A24|nr:flavin reductase [Clostridioides sp. ES-S-0049-03]MCC0657159.1 flavin reductase [Clostridioides sp. ES-S-0123-01]MCC0672573.1 flavin reductase [Clostridioides sp. ES-S-0145-01]MCC0675504.1 flavin reductase [Clostridioides sp. ES-W-0018-02]MCC0680121.1 flavin reductase [Clostridioides sp. ES-S-0005-03]MCC0701831.1 flavin reductase [Clostridioides sp. ES-S-0049-02]MCC0707694.1 flavin reductase [Clostridioides sp. ES-S-0190-01]MCC0709687.1 flavin reductase [Clostridioides sp. ES-W-0017-02]U